MANKFFDKIRGMVGSDDLEYNEYDDALFDDGNGEDDHPDADARPDSSGYDAAYSYDQQAQAAASAPNRGNSYGSSFNGNNSSSSGRSSSASAAAGQFALRVMKLDKYDEQVSVVADNLAARRSIVLNLEGANKENAYRILDFLSGVVYSIDGNLKRVAANTYIITPNNVDISNDLFRTEEKKKQGDSYFDVQ